MTPTEQEIRAALESAIADMSDIGDAVTSDVAHESIYPLWDHDEFRASETNAWGTLVSDAMTRVTDRLRPIIVEELYKAGVEFAREYPDAPRKPQPTPA